MATLAEPQPELLKLLSATARGDEKSFSLLYKKTSSRMYGVALRILRRQDWADDVMQEAYVKIWHNAGEYLTERGSVLTWMITILRYRAIDKLRSAKRDHLHDDIDDHDFVGGEDTDPLQLVEGAIDTQLLQGCMEELVEKQRQSIALAFFDGLTHEQLSAHYQAPLGTVKSWIRRGLLLLRRCLNNELQQARLD